MSAIRLTSQDMKRIISQAENRARDEEREACASAVEWGMDEVPGDYAAGYTNGREMAAEIIRRRGRDLCDCE